MAAAERVTGTPPGQHILPDSVSVATAEGRAAFEALAPEWDALMDRAGRPAQPFQDHRFLSVWSRHYLSPAETPLVLVARRAGRIAALLPMIRYRRLGLHGLRLMGSPIARFGDVVAEDDPDGALAEALRRALGSLGEDYVEAPLVRSDSAFCALGLDRGAVVAARYEAPYADLLRRVEKGEPGSAYPPKLRSNVRRRLRRLAESGEVQLASYGSGAEAVKLARRAIDLKKAWLVRSGLAAPTVFDPRFETFFADFAGEAGGPVTLAVSTIERNRAPIGIDLSFDFRDRGFGHIIATESCADKEGIGGLLVHHVFAAAQARGITTFELLTPADPHKMRHADGTVEVRDLFLPLSARGRIACATVLGRGLPAAKALARRLPPALTRAIAARTGY